MKRETVGEQYIKAQRNDTSGLLIQDVNSEMQQGLVEDINETIASNPFEGRDFYINVVEERDLQMKNAIKRRRFVYRYRPYPEDNTLVFHVEPRNNRVKYCWDLPHHSELYNILSNFTLYDHEYIARIREWMNNDLTNFGFVKVNMSSNQVEGYTEKQIQNYKKLWIQFLEAKDMDKKSLESEKKLGFFWVPNKFFKDKDITSQKPQILVK